MTITLRDYQQKAVDKILWSLKLDGNDLLSLPTGAGKSIVVAELAKRIDREILILQPSKEILEQNMAKLLLYVPPEDIGVFSASMNRKDIAKFTFATIGSVYKKPELFEHIGLVIIDECFVAGTKIDGRNIEDIRSGDTVQSFNHDTGTVENKKVVATRKRYAPDKLHCIDLVDGVIIGTGNHPFFVIGKGYVPAKNLQRGDEVIYESKQETTPNSFDLFGVRQGNSADHAVSAMGFQEKGRGIPSGGLRASGGTSKNLRDTQDAKSNVQSRIPTKNVGHLKTHRTQAQNSWGQRNGTDRNSESFIATSSVQMVRGAHSQNQLQEGFGRALSLQGGHSECGSDGSRGDRRGLALHNKATASGCPENGGLRISRVESVSILQQGRDGRYSDGHFHDYVYNLEVEDNNNYFANGVLVHNCHLVNPKNELGMFTSFLNAIGNPKVIGLTATIYRNVLSYHLLRGTWERGEMECKTTLKLINRMKPFFWNRLMFNIDLGTLTEQGYLCPLKYEHRSFLKQEDMKLNKSESDFDLGDLEKKIGTKHEQVVDAILDCQRTYKSILTFCSSVEQAERFAREMPGAEVVSAKTKPKERDRIINGFKDGTIQTVFNMGVLTTGFDHPELDCIVLLRPTRSVGLYYQMLGRGVRIAHGKTYCTVIDYVDTVRKLGELESIKLVKDHDNKWNLQTSTGLWHGRKLYSFATAIQREAV